MDDITDDMVFTPADGLEISEVPDGRVAYQASRERVHFLNPTAVLVLELCGQRLSVAEIGTFMQEVYGLPAPPADEVRTCISNMLSEQLLRPSSP